MQDGIARERIITLLINRLVCIISGLILVVGNRGEVLFQLILILLFISIRLALLKVTFYKRFQTFIFQQTSV